MLPEVVSTVMALCVMCTTGYAWRLHTRLHTDPLTGLANRAALERRFARARRRHERVAVLLADANRFKQLNDTYGHRFGDLVLCEIAHVLTRHAGPDVLPVRLHGDEFAVLLTGLNAITDPTRVADTLAEAVTDITVVNGQPVEVSLSIGAATGPATGGLPDLLARADTAMYRHKHTRTTVSR
ncbi:GGDEF domain-containing protein [Saccharopolyspora sp. 6V]|uniref:GGDEF domain-containing protein n=1 Tax=Saccharopolyspora sp. 6V TaxID=2877239 RepID=UPI001CD7B438|nr:GGDEF domain-containing protein [Saccharopolyspora sp. 6V]MCA1195342.1 GGDEF domain-containing protein [Saccharopolyspora sp. 6V]